MAFRMIAALAGLELGVAARRMLTAIVLAITGAILVLAAFAYALGAIEIYLSARYGSVEAALFIAAGLSVIAVAIFITLEVMRRRRARRRAAAALVAAAAPLATGLAGIRASGTVKALPFALLAGLVAGRYLLKE